MEYTSIHQLFKDHQGWPIARARILRPGCCCVESPPDRRLQGLGGLGVGFKPWYHQCWINVGHTFDGIFCIFYFSHLFTIFCLDVILNQSPDTTNFGWKNGSGRWGKALDLLSIVTHICLIYLDILLEVHEISKKIVDTLFASQNHIPSLWNVFYFILFYSLPIFSHKKQQNSVSKILLLPFFPSQIQSFSIFFKGRLILAARSATASWRMRWRRRWGWGKIHRS